MPDYDAYLTPDEFAGLPSAAQIAVWQAHAERRVDAAPYRQIYVYHRAQVRALLAGTALAS